MKRCSTSSEFLANIHFVVSCLCYRNIYSCLPSRNICIIGRSRTLQLVLERTCRDSCYFDFPSTTNDIFSNSIIINLSLIGTEVISKWTIGIPQSHGELCTIGIFYHGRCHIQIFTCMYELPVTICLYTCVSNLRRTVICSSLGLISIPSHLRIRKRSIVDSHRHIGITYRNPEILYPCIITYLSFSDIGGITHRMSFFPSTCLHIIFNPQLILTSITTCRRGTLYPVYPRRRNRQVLSGSNHPCLSFLCPFPCGKTCPSLKGHTSTIRQVLSLTSIILDKESCCTLIILITSSSCGGERACTVFLIIQGCMVNHLSLILKLIGTEVNEVSTIGLHLYINSNGCRERSRGRML